MATSLSEPTKKRILQVCVKTFKQVVSLQHVADMEIRLRDRPSAAQQSSRLRL